VTKDGDAVFAPNLSNRLDERSTDAWVARGVWAPTLVRHEVSFVGHEDQPVETWQVRLAPRPALVFTAIVTLLLTTNDTE
jgi:hypothetical protein